jgi:hypothetical protein
MRALATIDSAATDYSQARAAINAAGEAGGTLHDAERRIVFASGTRPMLFSVRQTRSG